MLSFSRQMVVLSLVPQYREQLVRSVKDTTTGRVGVTTDRVRRAALHLPYHQGAQEL